MPFLTLYFCSPILPLTRLDSICARQNGVLPQLARLHPPSRLGQNTAGSRSPLLSPKGGTLARTNTNYPHSSRIKYLWVRLLLSCLYQIMLKSPWPPGFIQTSPMCHDQASSDSQKLLINPAKKVSSLPVHPTELDLFRTTVRNEVSLQWYSVVSHLPIIISSLIYSLNSLSHGSLFSISAIVRLPAERKTHPRGTHTTLATRLRPTVKMTQDGKSR